MKKSYTDEQRVEIAKVDEPKEQYETQKRKLQKVLDNIQSLSKEITTVIQKQVQSDQELARLFQ